MALKNTSYDITKKILDTDYKVFVPNIALLLRENTAVKKGYMSAKGKASLGEVFKIAGKAKGLGGVVDFVSDKESTHIEASEVLIEKVLSLLSASRYMTGKIHSTVVLKDVKNLDGNFSLSSEKVFTQPRMMETLIGKHIALPMRLQSKGQIQDGNLSLFVHLHSDILALNLDNMQINTKTKHLKTSYLLDIPKLEDSNFLSKKNLYGAMKLIGTLSHNEILELQGYTDSLGGKITYSILDKGLESDIDKVSLENILVLFGSKAFFDGKVSGKMYYGLESKHGLLTVKIDDFHLKSTKMSNTIQGFIGKDPRSIIYSDSRLDAEIDGDRVYYTFSAIGSDSSMKIENGMIDTLSDTQSGDFVFVYDKYKIKGKITGTSSKAKFSLNISQ
jgi:hypothetical protein